MANMTILQDFQLDKGPVAGISAGPTLPAWLAGKSASEPKVPASK
jgi:hypothetical protein